MEAILDWVQDNEALTWGLLVFSVLSFLATLIIVPIIVVRLPDDYFHHHRRHPMPLGKTGTLLHTPLLVVKNILGVVFVLLGILMLVLPGQGLLTLFIGLVLLDFPGKYKLERWLVSQPAIFRSLNWIRNKAGKKNLDVELHDHD